MPATPPDLDKYLRLVAVSFLRHLVALSSAAAAGQSGTNTPPHSAAYQVHTNNLRTQLTSVSQHQHTCYP